MQEETLAGDLPAGALHLVAEPVAARRARGGEGLIGFHIRPAEATTSEVEQTAD